MVPIINKKKNKELKHLVEVGVLNTVQQSQYGNPIFIIPKKEVTVRFINYYPRLNQQLVRNPYPFPRIGETMQQLERFQCTIVLHHNMRYYTISIFSDSQDMMTIITECEKFRFNCLPMCALGYIFQYKVDKLLVDI